jgi:hypothetical protein
VFLISAESKWQEMLKGMVETSEIPDIYGGRAHLLLMKYNEQL